MSLILSLGTSLLALVLTAPLQDAPPKPAPPRPATAEEIRQLYRDYRWFDPVIDLKRLIEVSSVDEADFALMQQAALGAMVEALGDPYSIYIPPAAQRDLDKQLRGNYVGIGAEVDEPDRWPRIVAPLEGSPAQEAGLLPGDLILAIDGASTEDESVDASIERIMGEPGSLVSLTVRHADGREEELAIERRQLTARTVKGFRRASTTGLGGWEHMLDPDRGIAYVKLTQFTETTPQDLRSVLEHLRERGAKGLVLDLRFNGGGSLGAAIQIADYFLSSGTIVRVKGRAGDDRNPADGRSWEATDDPLSDIDMPLVVLVNESSASASEILAGAISENLGASRGDASTARVLGTRTFGKGSVQEVHELPGNRGSVKLTTARYYLPSGRNLSRSRAALEEGNPWGVDPDPGYRVAMDDIENRDLLLAHRPWEMPDGHPADASRWTDPVWIASPAGADGESGAADPQLAAALTALRERLAGNPWPRVGTDPAESDSAHDELRRAERYRERLVHEIEETDRRIDELRRAAHGMSRSSDPAESR